ncbi:ADP-ribosylglycohydrolase family protein [Nocardioides sp.]|uniref:ADP-ribosylglycohydrolase family protein n=1 Tax=Nocardioides sp. TaxID=35761 RepID=UPI00261286C8|nr:ADP-ribosylglycohydrolase family protein [Nocardioides sp.]MCW2739030.1 ADP-ribosylglycohydrolase [Nocardioides sp.]
MTSGPDLRDRIEGVLLASACGDALGVPYEFGSAPLAPDEQPRMIGGGLGPYAPGEWSDDTQMAVVVARVAASRGLADDTALDDVVDGWIDWLQAGASDVGIQTRAILTAIAAWRGTPGSAARARAAALDLHGRTGRTAGNGSLMRTAPVALACLGDPAALTVLARTVSDLTHADPLAGDACVLWCHAIRLAVVDGAVPDLADLLGELPVERRDQWSGWVAAAQARPPAAFAPNGYVVTALQAAWSAVRHPLVADSPIVGSLSAAVHAGDDTDTVAAIAGSLLGGCWGASSLPATWLADVHGWPGLRAEDLRALAHRVADR